MKINRFLKELNGVKVHGFPGSRPSHPRLQAQPERVLKKKKKDFQEILQSNAIYSTW